MKLSSAITLGFVSAGTALLLFAMYDHVRFQSKVSGAMTTEAAASIGIAIPGGGPWFKRVWFAPLGDGTYEVRPAAALIGVMPFTSTLTRVDLQAACKRLGDACTAL